MPRINETRRRSLLKAVSFRIIEIALDTLILSIFLEIHLALGLALALEGLCLLLHYGFERLWNRTDYGRGFIEDKGDALASLRRGLNDAKQGRVSRIDLDNL